MSEGCVFYSSTWYIYSAHSKRVAVVISTNSNKILVRGKDGSDAPEPHIHASSSLRQLALPGIKILPLELTVYFD